MVALVIDGKTVRVAPGSTVLEAAAAAGVDIPHLCHHPAFPPAGSCRLCAVEIEGLPKLEPACSTAVREGMVVRTNSPRVEEARRNVLEMLLAEHPMDCPVCDKAGECRLQDYYLDYSLAPGGYTEEKTKREKMVPLGRNLLLDRERCVLCTRCVRFLEKVTATRELGVFERGARSEVGLWEGRPVENNYSGCLAEICPVGAITDTDFRFKTRAWFLDAGESLCPLCGRGCAVVIESRPAGRRDAETARVFRVRSRRNDAVNGHWICDLGRYGYQYLHDDRCRDISGPAADRFGLRSIPALVSWLGSQLKALLLKGRQDRAVVVVSDWLTNEELFLAKAVFDRDLNIRRMHLVAPRDGSPDGMLLTAERSPNRAGAGALGFAAKEVRLEDLARETEMLLVFGPFLGEAFPPAEIGAALAGVKTKVLFTPKAESPSGLFDLVVPTAWPAEKEGTFTNCQGLDQEFRPALAPPPASREEWRLFVELGRAIGRAPSFYLPLRGPADIRRAGA